MAFSIMVHRVPEGITNPLREMGSWPLDRFPSMGDAGPTVARVNAALQAHGVETDGVDRASGLNLPHGVAAFTAAFADGQLRFLRAVNPNHDLIQLLVDIGGDAQWRVFDAKSGDELATQPPRPLALPTPGTQAYTPAPPQFAPQQAQPVHQQAPPPPAQNFPPQSAPAQPPVTQPPAAQPPTAQPNPQAQGQVPAQPAPPQPLAQQPPAPRLDPVAVALADMAQAVRAIRPADAELVNVSVRGVGDYLEGELQVLPSRVQLPLTGDIRRAAENLRRAMYQPEVGTWHEAEVTVRPEGEPIINTNQHTEPHWVMVPPARQFTRDLQRFPRATQHVPQWYIRPSEEVAQIDPGGMFTLAGTEENALRRRIPGTNLLIPVHHREQVGPNGSQQQLIFEIYLPQDCWRQGTQSPLAQWVDQQLVATALWQSETRTHDAELIWRVAGVEGADYLNGLLARHGITGIAIQYRAQNGAAA